jgi:hypothetical protein
MSAIRMFEPKAKRPPPAVDLRLHCPPVMDQAEFGSSASPAWRSSPVPRPACCMR